MLNYFHNFEKNYKNTVLGFRCRIKNRFYPLHKYKAEDNNHNLNNIHSNIN